MMAEVKRDVKYINKDFSEFRTNLIEYAKNYFPKTYNDFNETSPGMMFIEMASYIGDVLSYYTDYNMKETMLHHAQEKKNVYNIAQTFGYKPKLASSANATVDVFQLVPNSGTGASSRPDFDYAFTLEKGAQFNTSTNIVFRTTTPVNFAHSSSTSPTDVSVYQINNTTGQPEQYLLKKSVSTISGEIKTKTVTVGSADPYLKVLVDDKNIIGIESIVDGDGNTWYEVPYLAQDTIFGETVNSEAQDPTLSVGAVSAPYILKLIKTSRRFITRVTEDDKIEIQFGSGISSNPDEEIIPNPDNVGSPLPGNVNNLDTSFDPANFLYTNTYGQSPYDTTLTITYIVGYGLDANVPSKTITNVTSKTATFDGTKTLSHALKQTAEDSLEISNPLPATGGTSVESLDEIKNNALANFSTQNRMVTKEDYVIRALSLPSKFGNITKAYIASDEQLSGDDKPINNPLAVNMYVLGYDKNKNLTAVNNITKRNIKTYLSQYRMLTDAINIKDGYIVNFGIDFEITCLANRNSQSVLLKCVQALKDKFSIDKLSFSTPIITKDIYIAIANVDGVQSVVDVKLINYYDEDNGYSGNKYSFESATHKGVIYPSLDPSVFEIKYPDTDIRGRVVTY
jgi:hypothetical protein